MGVQDIIVVLIVGWALWTLIKMALPKKNNKGCSTGSCGCEVDALKGSK